MRWPRRKSKAPKQTDQEPLSTTPKAERKNSTGEIISPPSQHVPPPSVPHQATQQVEFPPAKPAPKTHPDGQVVSSVSDGVPLGLDATANEEITAIWAQVLERVRQLAQHEKKEVQEGLGIGDVIASLEASQAKEEESPTRQAVKTAFGRTMGLISTVGGIVSEGASTVSECRMLRPYDMTNREKVFAPAGQCYNAISFLIHAWEGYQGAFESLAVLLEQCSDHLGRLS